MEFPNLSDALTIALPTLKYMPGLGLIVGGLIGPERPVTAGSVAWKRVENEIKASGHDYISGLLLTTPSGRKVQIDYLVRFGGRILAVMVDSHVGTIVGAVRDIPEWGQRMPRGVNSLPISNPLKIHDDLRKAVVLASGLPEHRVDIVTVFPVSMDIHADLGMDEVMALKGFRSLLSSGSLSRDSDIADAIWGRLKALRTDPVRKVGRNLPKWGIKSWLMIAAGIAWLIAAADIEAFMDFLILTIGDLAL